MAARQKRELLRLLAFETKSQEIMTKMKNRKEEQEKKDAQLRAAKRRREEAAAEQARQREKYARRSRRKLSRHWRGILQSKR